MKKLKFICASLIITANVYPQVYNSDTVYIRINQKNTIYANDYKTITVSKDSSSISGYVRWDGTQFYFKDNLGTLYTLFSLKDTKIRDVNYFGNFGSFRIIKKSKNFFKVIPKQPIASHSNILKGIFIINYSKEHIKIKFFYNDGFGVKKEAIIVL